MAPLGENFRGNECNKICPLCSSHLDNQNSVFQCEEIKKKVDIKCALKDIYKQIITIETANTITKMEEIRENLLKQQE